MEGQPIHWQKGRICGSNAIQNNVTNQRGAALFLVLVYTQLMLIVVLHTLSFLALLRPISRNDQERMRIHYIGEAGVYLLAEEMLKEPHNYASRSYQIDGTSINAIVEPRGTHEIWIRVIASAPSGYSTRLWATVNKTTGKITNWSEFRIDN